MEESSPITSEVERDPSSICLYVISGGIGSSGEQLARTVIAQFPEAPVSIHIFPKVYTKKQVKQIVDDAVANRAILAHTFVDPALRLVTTEMTRDAGVVAVDLTGPLMDILVDRLNQAPLGKPGLYRQLYKSYFDRIDAMEYTLDHDDGKNPGGWKDAEIVLLGASRVGKTPISLYLSILGWKVANIPLVAGISPRDELFELDKSRLVGLIISPSELIEHREHRQKALGVGRKDSDYHDPAKVYEEIEEIVKFLRKSGIATIDVTGKPIETSADEVVRLVRRKLRRQP